MNKLLIALAMLLSVTALAKTTNEEIVLTSDNSILLDQQVNSETVSAIMAKALAMDSKQASSDPIYLILSTPGGSIQDGLEMITFLKGLNRPVHTLTIFAASMGFQTVQGLGTRYVLPFGVLMAHKAKGVFQGEFPGQIDSRYSYYIRRLNELDRITASRTYGKLSVKCLQDLYENEYWVDGFDAVDKGLADKVVSARCDQSLSGTRSENINFLGFSFKVTFSNCPVILGPVGVEAQVQTNQGLMSITDFLNKGGKMPGQTEKTLVLDPTIPAPTLNVENITMEKINAEMENLKKNYASKKRQVVVKE